MTTLAQVTALVEAHVRRDHLRFRSVVLQIAAEVALRSARGADQLRELMERSVAPLPIGDGLVSMSSELPSLDEMVLAPRVREQLDAVVLEQSRKGELLAEGLRPARKLLFTGPPGVGKTMASKALARAVGLPMFRVELHGVISSHLGETAGKLAKVFAHARELSAVYLFDEFDALAAERGSLGGEAAGAEMRRVVNSLLQFVEDDHSDSLVVAATNHEQLLDSAIFRRFDAVIMFTAPLGAEVTQLVRRALTFEEVSRLDLAAICAAVVNFKLGHGDVSAALDCVRKQRILTGAAIDTARTIVALGRRARARGEMSA